jgi:Reductase C-terminal
MLFIRYAHVVQGPAEARQDDVAAVRSNPSRPASANCPCVRPAFQMLFETPTRLACVENVNAAADHLATRKLIELGSNLDPPLLCDLAVAVKTHLLRTGGRQRAGSIHRLSAA